MGVSEKSYMMRTVASRGSLVQQLLQVLLFCSHVALLLQQVAAQGSWKVIVENAGIASMHTAITHYNTAVLLDRTDIGPSQLPLPNGVCRNDANDESSKHDCTAHSALLDLATNTIRPLFVQTDTWCSSGQFRADGTLVQTGGDNDGFSKVQSSITEYKIEFDPVLLHRFLLKLAMSCAGRRS
jgi:hypothetical protein